jgi:5-methylcytosine-specific restriction endonuclease McrA
MTDQLPLGKFAKRPPLVIERGRKVVKREQHRQEIRALVFARDHGMCRCCKGHATEMHELVFRSRGGKRSLYNSIAVCTSLGGANCHQMLQKHIIDWAYTDDERGADALIRFTMPATGRTWES